MHCWNIISIVCCVLIIVLALLFTAIPEDALNDESGEEEDKENPDERISSKFGLPLIFSKSPISLFSRFHTASCWWGQK